MDALLRWTAGPMLVVVVALAVIGVATAGVVAWRARQTPMRDAVRATVPTAAAVAAVASVVLLTAWPAVGGVSSPPNINLVPFRDLMRAAGDDAAWSSALADLGGNVAVFVPLGMALAARYKRAGALEIVGGVAALSTGIELMQALLGSGRATDVTDVLMNALGAVIGYAAWRLLRPARPASRLH